MPIQKCGDSTVLGSVFATLFVEAGKLMTFMNRGKAGLFLAIRGRGDTPEEEQRIQDAIRQHLTKANGYSNFKGAYTKLVKTPQDLEKARAELDALAGAAGVPVDFKGLDIINTMIGGAAPAAAPAAPAPTPMGTPAEGAAPGAPAEPGAPVIQPDPPVATDKTVPVGDTPTDTLQSMSDKIKTDLKAAPADQRMDVMNKMITDYLDKLAGEVDEAKKQEFLKEFLAFSSKFWRYSFNNQMLIWFQSHGQATEVAGYNDWRDKYGRQVQMGAKQLVIFIPLIKKMRNKVTGEEEEQCYGFKLGGVFDISATKPLEGEALAKWQGKNPGKQPFQPASKDWWMSTNVEDTEKTIPLRNAAIRFAEEKKIDVTTSEDTGGAGGYSQGGEISINYESAGERQLSTIIHELAHELLHWAARKKDPDSADIELGSKMDLEVDAESVAYIVMKHFGFEAGHAPNYLALHGAAGSDVRRRRGNIQKAVRWIIEGITKNLEKPGTPQAAPPVTPPVTPQEQPGAVAKWVRSNCRFAADMEGWDASLLGTTDMSYGYDAATMDPADVDAAEMDLDTTVKQYHGQRLPKRIPKKVLQNPAVIEQQRAYQEQGRRMKEQVDMDLEAMEASAEEQAQERQKVV